MITELSQTASLMDSPDYKERFRAEYYQLKIRLEKLVNMLIKWDNNELNFNPTCPRELYDFQVNSMEEYLKVLKIRAHIEGIELQ